MNPRHIAGNAEEEEEEVVKPKRYSWERRRRRRMVNPRDIAGNVRRRR